MFAALYGMGTRLDHNGTMPGDTSIIAQGGPLVKGMHRPGARAADVRVLVASPVRRHSCGVNLPAQYRLFGTDAALGYNRSLFHRGADTPRVSGQRPESTVSSNVENPISSQPNETQDFLRTIVAEDQRNGRYGGRVVTRFPPEPNGYLHIGHAKSICLNFGIAQEFGGVCHLRMDDTNPETEDMEFVATIQETIRWLGFDWGEHLYYASDYSAQLYDFAERLITLGRAYVDDLSDQEIREYRGTVTTTGRESPYRSRSVEENLDLFRRMRAGEFADGSKVLRAKIDMASPNMKMRDPLLYRIRHATHYRTGDDWCIYPFYDYAHPLSDQIEQVTHSICTLEFENNREIYDWLLDSLVDEPRPHQYEFARLNLDYTVMSKRKLLQLVEEGFVAGWDDPRLPTIAGLRRRGVTPSSIRSFAERIGVAKSNSRVEMNLLDSCIRDDLNPVAPRVMAVLNPVKLIIDNYAAGETEWLDAPYYPHDVPREGTRKVPFSRELYIERADFMEEPPKGFYRLAPGREVRLRHAYIVTCTGVVKDDAGKITAVRCTYDPATRSGAQGAHKKTQTAIQWVSAPHAVRATVRLYDRLLRVADPDAEGMAFKDALNPNALEVISGAWVEPSVVGDPADTRYQFERTGYFWQDPVESTPNALIFNRIVGLRDSWSRATGRATYDAGRREAPVDEPAAEGKPRIPERSPALQARRERYAAEWGLPEDEAELLTREAATADFFEETLAADPANPRALATWINHELPGELNGRALSDAALTPAALAALVRLVDDNVISTSGARTVFSELVTSGGEPAQIVEARGLRQVADGSALLPIVERVIAAHADKVAQYRAGKTGLLGFFTGQVMRETSGAANAAVVQELLSGLLDR